MLSDPADTSGPSPTWTVLSIETLLARWDAFDCGDYVEDSEALAALVDLVDPIITALRP